jgi:hypothetical protein
MGQSVQRVSSNGEAKKKLNAQIDELAEKQIITASLKEMAHEVRLTGNDGAHPGEDGLNDVSPEDATDMIQFTQELFHHVYVMPAKLKARKALPPSPDPSWSGRQSQRLLLRNSPATKSVGNGDTYSFENGDELLSKSFFRIASRSSRKNRASRGGAP